MPEDTKSISETSEAQLQDQSKRAEPFLFLFAEDFDGSLAELEKSLKTGRPETLPAPVDK